MTNRGDTSIENVGFFFYCHSERAFGRGRIPTVSAGFEVWQCYFLSFMIRPLRTWDSSLRSEWQAGVILPLRTWDSSFIVILNELLGEEESLQWVRGLRCDNVISFHLWSVLWDVRFFTAFRMTNKGDSPIENARFFTAFGMTNRGDTSIENVGFFFYCHSERAFGRGRIPTVSAGFEVWQCYFLSFMIRPLRTRDSSLRSEWQTGVIRLLRTWDSSFNVILNELLGEEESLQCLRAFVVYKCYRLLIMIRPLRTRDSSLRSEWQTKVIVPLRTRDSSLRSEWQTKVILTLRTRDSSLRSEWQVGMFLLQFQFISRIDHRYSPEIHFLCVFR